MTTGREDDFIGRWTDLLRWTRENHPGLVSASLIREDASDSHFVSFAEWQDEQARTAWQQSPGFAERARACRELCDQFVGGNFTRVVEA